MSFSGAREILEKDERYVIWTRSRIGTSLKFFQGKNIVEWVVIFVDQDISRRTIAPLKDASKIYHV